MKTFKEFLNEAATLDEVTKQGWYLVMANNKVTGVRYDSKQEATKKQKEAPVATEVKFGTVSKNGQFLEG